MAAQHAYREGNQWGMTVAELLEAAVTDGRPLALDWDEAGRTWDWPDSYDASAETIVMPAITDDIEPAAPLTKHALKEHP